MWNPNGEAPADFLAELYGEKSDEEQLELEDMEDLGEELEEVSSDDDEIDPEPRSSSPAAPPYSPLTSPSRRGDSRRESRSRSRSPRIYVAPESLPSAGVIIRLYSESGVPLTEEMGSEAEFVSSDAHALFDRLERMQDMEVIIDASEMGDNHSSVTVARGAEVERHVRARSVRGRVRGGRRGRVSGRGRSGRGHGGGRRQRGAASWQVGHPLEEIWVTDDDVPPELREMARDVVRRRQESVQVSARGRRSTRDRAVDEGDDSASEVEDDVFYDAADGRDNAMLEGEDLHFEWFPMETFRGEEITFRPERTGSVPCYTNPYDAFRSYWDDGILQDIVAETNRYATKISSAAFQSSWYPTNSDELLCLFAFWMMSGIIGMPTVCSYFSSNNLLKTEVFSHITTLKRYNSLNRALHFVDTDPASDAAYSTNSGAASFDRMHRLRPIIDHLNSKFQSNYILSKDICIDESLTHWKGRLNFKQYIRSKAAKFGIKTFELCESATGYLWSFLVYTGKQSSFDLEGHMSKSATVVRKLIRPLLNKGHRLFMDNNWFNSPFLARFLKRNGTDCVGTLCPSRQHVPKLVTQAPLKQGQLIARHSGEVCVLSWPDKKKVNMISTCLGSAVGLSTVASHPPQRPLPYKPQAVLDYNRSMGGVDLKDQMLEPYLLERKRCAMWYLKLFKRLLNCSIHNSRVLLVSSLNAWQDNLKFRLELVQAILTHHHHLIPLGRRANASRSRLAPFSHIVHHAHWPARITPSAYEASLNRQGRQRCAVCWTRERKVTRTGFKCEDCDVPLSVVDCFKAYHATPH